MTTSSKSVSVFHISISKIVELGSIVCDKLIPVNQDWINIVMRSQQDKQTITNHIDSPFTIENFISQDELVLLTDYFKSSDNHTHKNTGPVTMNVTEPEFEQPLFKNILERLEPYIGRVRVFSSLYFYVERPHIIHNDDSFSYPVCYKGINIPLEIEYVQENTGWPNLVFYDQYYLEGPAKFFNGSDNVVTHYNKCVYEYSEVGNLSTTPIDNETRRKYLTHLKPEWLEGLSIDTITRWKPGDITVFDSVRLHSSNDFVRQGIKSKLGLSIFTERR